MHRLLHSVLPDLTLVQLAVEHRCRKLQTGFYALKSMKTTLHIDDRLLADAKALAAQQRTSLTRLIEKGLPVFKGRGGLAPGLDPCSNRSVLKALGDDA